jgi:hypothetical protein
VYCFADEPLLIFPSLVRRIDCPIALRQGKMRIHGNSMNLQPVNLYSAAEIATTAAARRAAEARKRLLKSAHSASSDPELDAIPFVGQWLDSRHSQVLPPDEGHTDASVSNPDLG